jgi:quinol-cytochrome oxidoreductase complex cytochrome b subunit
MSKVDEIKEELGWLKVAFGVLIVTIVSVLGWIAQNILSADKQVFITAVLVLLLLIFITVKLNKFAYKKIRSLRDL